ncbi:helix-turn-helix domain-containing protein [Cerasicoccus maritimus]|uniref:helix-turn-helix domain-containing protein n=1 Tax=Cerasicoccus maritimus TaxID=490089 RepID=UPI0028526E11|nr:AraC family transcriptional regulator [Cerasicoccus maritimus]
MAKLALELSLQVKESRYLSLTRKPKQDGVFYAGFEVCAPDFLIDRENFPFWMLEYISEGQGEMRVRGKKHQLGAGSLICYGPGIPIYFHNRADHPFHKYFFCRTDGAFPDRWRQCGLTPGSVNTLSLGSPFCAVMDQLIFDGAQGYAEKVQTLNSLELILTSYIRRDLSKEKTNTDGPAQVYEIAMRVLNEEYREINSLAELADRTGYGSEYLCRIFKRYHNESPYQALLRMKMNEAFRQLKDGRLRVMDIAQQVGFDDPLHFSRVFKKTMGMPPSMVNG